MSNIHRLVTEYRDALDNMRSYSRRNVYLRKPEIIPEEFNKFDIDYITGHGNECIAFQMNDGDVLKMGHTKPDIMRNFDAPCLDFGEIYHVPYLIQPYVEMSHEMDDVDFFIEMIGAVFNFHDPYPDQIGTLENRLVLVDYNAVKLRHLIEYKK